MQKLELKHLAAYLPYNLKVQGQTHKEIFDLCGIDGSVALLLENGKVDFFDIKPILRPLSDLTKEIEVNGIKYESVEHYFEEIYYTLKLYKQVNSIIQDERWVNHCEYVLVEFLFEYHFDVFGLIEQNLAIDINTLNK